MEHSLFIFNNATYLLLKERANLREQPFDELHQMVGPVQHKIQTKKQKDLLGPLNLHV